MKSMVAWAAGAFLALSAGAQQGEKVDKRHPAAPDGVVEIEVPAGTLSVVGWDRPEVWVTGTLGRRVASIEVTGEARRVRVEVDTEGYNPLRARADLEVHVPAGSRVEVEAFSAPIKASGLSGSLKAETVHGGISVSGSLQEVSLETVNGGVDLAGTAERTAIEAVNGPVTIKGARGRLKASAVNGSLTVEGEAFEAVELETVSGALTFRGTLRPKASLDADSVSGAIELWLPAEVAADFSVETFSGSIANDFGPEAESRSRHTPQKELSFTTGGGGATVSVSSLSGSIRLKKR
jgi:DUF4097 and DUF4098 domain-containing protein YvlB